MFIQFRYWKKSFLNCLIWTYVVDIEYRFKNLIIKLNNIISKLIIILNLILISEPYIGIDILSQEHIHLILDNLSQDDWIIYCYIKFTHICLNMSKYFLIFDRWEAMLYYSTVFKFIFLYKLIFVLMDDYIEGSEPKWVNPILNIIGVSSLRLGGLHMTIY